MDARYIVAAIALVGLAGTIAVQRHMINTRDATIQTQSESIGSLTTANAMQDGVIRQLRANVERDNRVLAENAKQIENLSNRQRSLDRKIRESLNNAKNLTLDSVLPVDASNALCMQYHAASGDSITSDNQGDTSLSPDAGAGNSVASRCAGWYNLTLRDVVEWSSLLLQHAGLERLDKSALRAWAGSNN